MDFKLKKSNLNFRVYTASSLPNTGNENDICVISDVPMKNWILSPDAPSGAPCTDGDVWIKYSASGNTRNVLKNGTMEIATISAHQYVSGAWVNKEAKSYHNGAWTDWLYYIFKSGSGKKVNLILTDQTNSTVTMTNEKITIDMATTSYGLFCVTTENPVDLTRYKKLVCELQCSKQHHENDWVAKLTVDKTRKVPDKTNDALASVTLVANNVRRAYEIDISQMTGEYYIALRGGCSAVVYNWYLE